MTYEIDRTFEMLKDRLDTTRSKNIPNSTINKTHSENFLFEQFVARMTQAFISCKVEGEFKFSFFGDEINISDSVAIEVAQKMPDTYYTRFGNGAYYLLTLCVHWHLLFLQNFPTEESKNPFEPILRLLERGGSITKEGRLYSTGNKSFREVQIHTKIVDCLDDQFLDNLH